MTHASDVGGWFKTARTNPVSLGSAWGRTPGEFGKVSSEREIDEAAELILAKPTLVLTGAGMSTGSGLPDYRGRDAVPRTPMTFQEFVSSDLSRRHYWARSTVGWKWFRQAQPGATHLALAELGRHAPLATIVTQNVDQLHQAAGSSPVIDLHGALADVRCLGCGARSDRADLQGLLLEMNPRFAASLDELADQARTAPDGDAEVDQTADFNYPSCPDCGGMLKPDVVFFGENADRAKVDRANRCLDEAELLLVLGTSLSVMSGLRFVRQSARAGKPVIICNDGPTRGDELATHRIHGRLEKILGHWVD